MNFMENTLVGVVGVVSVILLTMMAIAFTGFVAGIVWWLFLQGWNVTV